MFSLDPLANPTRLRIVRHLSERGSSSLGDLAIAADVHANTLRPNLVELEREGIIQRESRAGGGRGRPRSHYRLVDGWTLPTADFRGLAEVLAAALLRVDGKPEEMRAVGLEWGRYLLGRPGVHDLARDLPRALEHLGYQVRLSGSTLHLSACPCYLVAPDRPELICNLAIAVADGVLAGAGSQLRVRDRHHDPAIRSCSGRLEPIDTDRLARRDRTPARPR